MHTTHPGLRAAHANSRPWGLAAAACMVLAGCGGGGGAGDSSADAADPVVTQTAGTGAVVPLGGRDAPTVGDFWDLDVDGGGQDVQRVVGTAVVGGEAGFEFQRTVTRPGLATATQHWILVPRDGPDVVHARAGFDPLAAAFFPRRSLLDGPLRVGHRAVLTQGPVPVAADYDNDGRNDSASLRIETDVVGIGPQTTPAGSFADCMQTQETVTYTVTLSGGQPPLSKVVRSDIWFASGGARTVRLSSVTEERWQGALLSAPSTFGVTLVGFRAGSASGGTVR